jgi:hypothetical protein
VDVVRQPDPASAQAISATTATTASPPLDAAATAAA